MRAASTGAAGTICSAASAISMVKGNHSQDSAITIAHNAVSGLVISEPTGRPIHSMNRWNGLMSTAYMTRQTMPTTIGGSTIGMRNPERANRRIAIEQQGNTQPHEELHRHGRDRELHLHPHRTREARIVEQVEIVAERR